MLFCVNSLKMVTMSKDVGIKELKNTLIVELCMCWCYRKFNVLKYTIEIFKSYKIWPVFVGMKSELTPWKKNSSLGSAIG
jgi:hypothetical protein